MAKSKGGKEKAPKSPAEKIAAVLKEHKLTAEFVASDGGCLDQEVATNLVFSCTGVGPVAPEVKLGQLFPGTVQRQGFCGCVFNKARMAGSDVKPGEIPCSPSTKISAVIDSISC